MSARRGGTFPGDRTDERRMRWKGIRTLGRTDPPGSPGADVSRRVRGAITHSPGSGRTVHRMRSQGKPGSAAPHCRAWALRHSQPWASGLRRPIHTTAPGGNSRVSRRGPAAIRQPVPGVGSRFGSPSTKGSQRWLGLVILSRGAPARELSSIVSNNEGPRFKLDPRVPSKPDCMDSLRAARRIGIAANVEGTALPPSADRRDPGSVERSEGRPACGDTA